MLFKELPAALLNAGFTEDNVGSIITLIKKQKVKADTAIEDAIIDNLLIPTEYKNKIKSLVKKHNTEQNSESLTTQLMKINGIGNTKAMELIQKNLTSVKDLEKKEYFDLLSDEAKLFVKLKPITVIPRQIITNILSQMSKCGFKFNIAGSYLRETDTSSDIDILTPDNFDLILKELEKIKAKTFVYAKGEDKMSLLARFDMDKFKRFVKIDFFKYTKSDYLFQLVYLTGSKNFNIIMRRQASKLGMLLNQKGLFKVLPDKKFEAVPVKSEKDLFNILKMEYRSPAERNLI